MSSWIDKKDIEEISDYFRETKYLGGRVKVELDLCIYATKAILKSTTGVDTSSFAKKLI